MSPGRARARAGSSVYRSLSLSLRVLLSLIYVEHLSAYTFALKGGKEVSSPPSLSLALTSNEQCHFRYASLGDKSMNNTRRRISNLSNSLGRAR